MSKLGNLMNDVLNGKDRETLKQDASAAWEAAKEAAGKAAEKIGEGAKEVGKAVRGAAAGLEDSYEKGRESLQKRAREKALTGTGEVLMLKEIDLGNLDVVDATGRVLFRVQITRRRGLLAEKRQFSLRDAAGAELGRVFEEADAKVVEIGGRRYGEVTRENGVSRVDFLDWHSEHDALGGSFRLLNAKGAELCALTDRRALGGYALLEFPKNGNAALLVLLVLAIGY